jgi:hypothetical protein
VQSCALDARSQSAQFIAVFATHVTVELPGMKAEDVKVEFREGSLWITGEKKELKEEKGKTFHRVEGRSGIFRQILPLPGEVKEQEVDARFADGVLKITLPTLCRKQKKLHPSRSRSTTKRSHLARMRRWLFQGGLIQPALEPHAAQQSDRSCCTAKGQ